MEDFPDFVRRRLGGAKIWIAGGYQAPNDLGQLVQGDSLFERPDCVIVKDQRKIKVARIRLSLGGRARTVYLKRYNAFSWRFKLGSLFSASGARRALRGSIILRDARISTPEPIGAMERRCWGVLTKSFFFSEAIEDGKTADAYWRECLRPFPGREGYRRRRAFLSGLAALFRGLHEKRVYHNDLKDANILVAAGAKAEGALFYLLDFEGIRKCRRLSRRRRLKNLVQLNRTLGKYLHQSEKLHFLHAYLHEAFLKGDEKRRWVADVVSESLRLDRRKFSRRFLSNSE